MDPNPHDPNFLCALTISLPLPTHRLASSALQALQVDAELSPLVQRAFSLTTLPPSPPNGINGGGSDAPNHVNGVASSTEHAPRDDSEEDLLVLRTVYKATTNRMLRVAVNGFMESLGLVLGVMGELDGDVLLAAAEEG